LLVAGAVSVAVGASFAAVAAAVLRRKHGGIPLTAFAVWWAALAGYLVLQGSFTAAAGLGDLDPRAYRLSRIVTIPLLCAGVWGLTSFLLYVYTGKRRVFAVVGVLYALVAALFYYATFGQGTLGVTTQTWILSIDDSGALYRIVYGLVGVPPIAAAVAYLLLLRHVDEPMQRYRIILVAGSILAYVGSGLAARLLADDALIFVTLVLFGALAGAASVLAYFPPAWVRLRLDGEGHERLRARAEREKARQRRWRDLI